MVLTRWIFRHKRRLRRMSKRILAAETNIKDIYLEQLYTFGAVNRDPRTRVVSTSYMALIDKNQLKDKLSEEASWFDIKLIERADGLVSIKLESQKEKLEFIVKKKIERKPHKSI